MGAEAGLVVRVAVRRAFGVVLKRVAAWVDLGSWRDNSGLGSLLDHCIEEVVR